MKGFAVIFVVIQCFILINCAIPNNQEPCRKSDPNLRKCLIRGAAKLIPLLRKGFPEYNIPVLDPFEVPRFEVNRTLDELATINAVFTKLKIIGISQVAIDYLDFNLEKMRLELQLSAPFISGMIDYNGAGTLMSIPLKLEGHFAGNCSKCKVRVAISFTTYENEGVEYFAVTDFKLLKVKQGDAHITMTATKPQDQYLADFITNAFYRHRKHPINLNNPAYANAVTAIENMGKNMMTLAIAKIPVKHVFVD